MILNHSELIARPPILLDIGASGGVPRQWKKIAKYSICIAFDPDEREMRITEQQSKDFKKYFIINKVVSSEGGICNFYLTKSPYCSSMLEPDIEHLTSYQFKNLFEISEKITIESVTLNAILSSCGLKYVDWFKADTQGTDLRIFKSLNSMMESILVAEFEPGIVDAYKGEDKMWHVLKFMEEKKFWLSRLDIKGAPRINYENYNLLKNKHKVYLKNAALWGEMIYLQDLDINNSHIRELLTACLFGIILQEFGYVYDISSSAKTKFPNDPIWGNIQLAVEKMMQPNFFKIFLKKLISLFDKYFDIKNKLRTLYAYK